MKVTHRTFKNYYPLISYFVAFERANLRRAELMEAGDHSTQMRQTGEGMDMMTRHFKMILSRAGLVSLPDPLLEESWGTIKLCSMYTELAK